MRTHILVHDYASRNDTVSLYSQQTLAGLNPSEADLSYLSPTACVNRETTLTQESSHIPPLSSSLATIVTATSTIYIYKKNNNTVADGFKESYNVVAGKSVFTTISDIAEICLRLLHMLMAVYHIRITIKLLGQCRFTVDLGQDMLTNDIDLYQRHVPAQPN